MRRPLCEGARVCWRSWVGCPAKGGIKQRQPTNMTMQPSEICRSTNHRRRGLAHLLFFCNLGLRSSLGFWLSSSLLKPNCQFRHTRHKCFEKVEKTYLLGSNLLLGLFYCTVDLILCLLDNLLSLSGWALLNRSRLCDASRSNSLSTWLGCVGFGRFLWSCRLCDGLDLSWDGDAGLRSGLGASGGGGSHFIGFERNVLVKYESFAIGDRISEVYPGGKRGCCCALRLSFGQSRIATSESASIWWIWT